jgi:hypothetical protein
MLKQALHDANFVPSSFALGFRKRVQPALDRAGARGLLKGRLADASDEDPSELAKC